MVPGSSGGLTAATRSSLDLAHQAMTPVRPMLAQYPLSFGQWLQALNYTLSKPWEIAIVSDPKAADTEALQNVVRDGYRLFQAVALGAPSRDFACQAPIRNPGELRAQLGPQ